jgi:type I restriction enzyme S subunit
MMFYKETNFKETSIGKIPEEWKVVRFQDICEKLRSGGTPLTSKKQYYNGEIPFVKIEDITNAKKYLSSTITTITKEGLNNSTAWLVPENSLLLAIYGSLGSVAINTIELATNQAILGIVLKRGKVETEFFYYLFSHLNLKKYAKRTTQANLTAEIIKNLKIPLPLLEEQKAITQLLSTVDEAIQKTDEIIAKTERLKKGLMQELLTKGIGHKEFKDAEIGRIPKEWEAVKVGDVLSLEYGSGLPERERIPGTYPVVGSNGIVGYHNQAKVKGPGIVVGRKGTIGAVSWIDRDFWPIDTTYYVRTKTTNVSLKWLFYELIYLNPARFHLADVVPGLKRELVHSLKMILPPLHEQQEIAETLSTVDKKLELERSEKVKLERIKQGLMNLLLTGKIRVKVN